MPTNGDSLSISHRNARIDAPPPPATGRKPAPRKRPAAKPNPPAAHREEDGEAGGAAGPAQQPQETPEPRESLSVRSDVWAAYATLRSVRGVAAKLGMSPATVRQVLEADKDRLRVLLDDLHEERAAMWASRERRVGAMLDTVLDTYDGLMLEIADAMADGRVTRIRNDEGGFLPVIDAIQLVVMSKIADQTVRIAQVSRTLANESSQATTRLAAAEVDELQGLEAYADEELAAIVEEAGVSLPPMLAQKLKRVENTAQNDNAPR